MQTHLFKFGVRKAHGAHLASAELAVMVPTGHRRQRLWWQYVFPQGAKAVEGRVVYVSSLPTECDFSPTDGNVKEGMIRILG